MMATAIYAVSIPIALVIWGLGLVWLVLAVSSLVDLWLVSKLTFNLGWWGFTFPLGVFATAAIKFGSVLDSGAFRVMGTILALVEVVLWMFISAMTLRKARRERCFSVLVWPRCAMIRRAAQVCCSGEEVWVRAEGGRGDGGGARGGVGAG